MPSTACFIFYAKSFLDIRGSRACGSFGQRAPDISHTLSRYLAYSGRFKPTRNTERSSPGPAFLTLLIDACKYLTEIHELIECVELLDIASEACKDKQSLEYAYVCNLYLNVAVETNEIAMGRSYFQQAIAIREAKPPADHPDLAGCYNNIGNNLLNEGNVDDALNYLSKVDKIFSVKENGVLHGAIVQLNMARGHDA